jgi:CRP/FNR family transcriptional regulator, cyclic AMP receptor protein
VITPVSSIFGEQFPQVPVSGELPENEISQSGLRANVVPGPTSSTEFSHSLGGERTFGASRAKGFTESGLQGHTQLRMASPMPVSTLPAALASHVLEVSLTCPKEVRPTMNTLKPKGPFQELLNDATISTSLADRIVRGSSVHDIPAQTYLQHVADEPGGMWGLAAGSLSVEFTTGMRDPQMGYSLLPPAWVGEGGVVAGRRRLVGLSTTRRSLLLHLPVKQFASIAQEDPLIWRWVAQEQNRNFERSLGMTDALMVRSSEARVAAVLRQLGGRLGTQTEAPRVLDITQVQLAAIVNVSRSVLSPILGTLASTGIIELGHRTITILDPVALQRQFWQSAGRQRGLTGAPGPYQSPFGR